MFKVVDAIDETLAKLVAGGSPVYLKKSPFCWLIIHGDPDGNSLTIHQRKSSS